MRSERLARLLTHQQNILSKIALGETLSDVFDDICLAIEEILDDKSAKCSILSLTDNQLFHCAAPSISPQYCELINGIEIGPVVGSCGTAAYKNTQVIVENINTSPLWQDFKELALQFNLQSCWSTPIISTNAQVLGSFAIYHDHPKAPSNKDLELIDYFVNFSSIALEKKINSLKVDALIKDLEKSNEKFAAFTKVMPDSALILNEDGIYVDIYGISEDLLCRPINELINRNVNDILPKKDADAIIAVIEKTLASNEVQIFEYEIETETGKVVFEGRTAPITNYQSGENAKKHVLWMDRDITTRKNAEKAVEKLAYYDPLTNLPNRRLLSERLTLCVERINRSQKTGALLFLDIDDFKRVNDSLGHSAGDELLIELAKRLNAVVRASDTLARIGGDEFVILLEYVGEDNEQANSEAVIVAQKVQQVFVNNFEIGELCFKVSGSIGICLIDNNNSSADNILKFADTAMYRAKVKGGNSYSFYDPKLQTLLEKQTEIETDIVRALQNHEFCAYFQPQVNVVGNIIGGEALIRWNHPSKGLIYPNDFIPIAEQFGLIQQLQNIVLEDICYLLKALLRDKIITDVFNFSINVSQCQFNSTTLKSELLEILHHLDIEPARIKLEITETMLSDDINHTVDQMEELQEEGFAFSIDDFGTGYSCLSHLHAYPVKELKVDKSFIDKMLDSDSGLSIVQSIINLAKNLHILVVAEGVENQDQFEMLKKLQVDGIQGYLISKPLPLDQYLLWHTQYLSKRGTNELPSSI